MTAVHPLILVALGGAAGSALRYTLAVGLTRWLGAAFPWATFAINISGSFAIGLLTVLLTHYLHDPRYRLVLIVGFLGGYTTFSSFSLEAHHLWELGHPRRALAYMTLSVAVGFLATTGGVALGFEWVRRSPHVSGGLATGPMAPPSRSGPVDRHADDLPQAADDDQFVRGQGDDAGEG